MCVSIETRFGHLERSLILHSAWARDSGAFSYDFKVGAPAGSSALQRSREKAHISSVVSSQSDEVLFMMLDTLQQITVRPDGLSRWLRAGAESPADIARESSFDAESERALHRVDTPASLFHQVFQQLSKQLTGCLPEHCSTYLSRNLT